MSIALTSTNYVCTIKSKMLKNKALIPWLLLVFLLTWVLISPAGAATIDWKISPSNPAVGDMLKIKGVGSPGESIRAEVSFEKVLPVSKGKYQYLLEVIKVPKAKDNLFKVEVNGSQNLHVGVKKLAWINFYSEASEGVANISHRHVPPFSYRIIIDGEALSTNSPVNLTITASQTLKADSKGKFGFNYDTSTMPAGNYTIKIGDSEKTIELMPKGKTLANISASSTSGGTLSESTVY